MPFRAPEQPDPLRVLLQLQSLKQAQQEQEQRDYETKLNLGLHLLGAGGDLSSVDPAVQQQLAPVAEALRQQQAQESVRYGVGVVAPSLVEAIAPRANEAGNVVAPSDQEIQQRLSLIDQTLPPEQAAVVKQYVATAAQGAGAATAERVAGERRAGAQQRTNALFAQSLDVAEARRREQNARDEAFIEDAATRVAATNNGLVDPRENTAVAQDIQAQFGTDPVKMADASRRISSRAVALSAGFGEKLRLTEGANTANVRAVQEQWGLAEPAARLWVSGFAGMDPVLSEPGRAVVVPVARGGAEEWEKGRYALKDAMMRVADLESTFDRAAEQARIAGNIGGPLVGSQGYQEFLRVTGQQPAIAAEYDAKRREMVSLLLKARQGARPSDYDLRFYMALVPSLEELFSGSAQGRFKALNDSLAIAAQSAVSPAIGAQIAARKDRATPVDEMLAQAADDYASGRISGAQFDQSLSAWKQQRGARFTLPSAGGSDQPSAPASAVDDVLRRHAIGSP